MCRATRRLFALLSVTSLVILAGCLPIELSVSPDGKILIPRREGFISFDPVAGTATTLHSPKSGQPAFAVFSPDGGRFLAISKSGDFDVSVAAVGKAPKKLLSTSNLTYARWSPDGKWVSLTQVADEAKKPIKQNMPELVLVNVADGKKRTLASNVSAFHRWFGDSQHVLAFQIAAKNEETNLYAGALVKLNTATGKAVPLATVLGGNKVFFDLSPDGAKVLFTAVKAAKAGQELPAKAKGEPQLFELDIASGAIRTIKGKVLYALYSPKGTKVLVGMERDFKPGLQLAVADAAMKNFVTVATDGAKSAGETGDSADIYPGWINESTVHYIAKATVFGTAGKNLHLMSVGADGTGRRNLQTKLDAALAK